MGRARACCAWRRLQLLPTDKLKKLAWPALGIATVLLMMVLVFGEEIYGNKNWLFIGGFSVQPSEFAKAAMALWGAAVVERKAHLMDQWKHAVMPLVAPFGGLMLGLVHDRQGPGHRHGADADPGGGDVRRRGPRQDLRHRRRRRRPSAWPLPCSWPPRAWAASPPGSSAAAADGARTIATRRNRESTHWPPAAGSGVGLGQSRQKWSHIPEAQNDFIFAVLGEEMGLLGTLFVVLLYTMLAVAMFRIAVRSETIFGRVAVSGIMAWIIGQAFVNIGMVIGLLPVIGVPLPFISSGGSALLATFLGIGVVLSFAREQRMGKQGRATPGMLAGFMARLRGAKAN